MRVEEIRTRGVVPTLRTRVEEVTSQVRQRVGGTTGGILTRESGSEISGSTSRKKLRGL